MKLSPRIIQAMEILQLPMLALAERIDQELESNPVLELNPTPMESTEPAEPAGDDEGFDDRGEHQLVVDEGNGNSEDFERLAQLEAEYGPELLRDDLPPPSRRTPVGERDRKMDAMANAAAPAQSLNDYLQEQWAFVEVDAEVHRAGRLIVDNIDSDGYLRIALDEVVRQAKPPIEMPRLVEALQLVKTLEPTGVGAVDLKECLLIQLQTEAHAGQDVALEIELVSHFLRDIEMNRLPHISQKTGKDIEQIKAAIENLSHLNPRPGSLVGEDLVPGITPDVIVELADDGHVVVATTDGNTPRLGISKHYQQMIQDRQTDKIAKRFLRNNIRSAEWLMSAIGQRRRTIHRVAEEVFQVQREFLELGGEALKPLPMADVARKVGVHVATVSRAVAGKYVQTPQGIHPLRMFFSGGTTTAEGEDVAWGAVKAKLKEVIDAEDKVKPLSDDQLVVVLKKNGIEIARRTVAKYRGLLSIPPARKRKQY